MDCSKAEALSLDGSRGALPSEQAAELRRHLSTCPQCSAHFESERALNEVLETKLPRHGAPVSLQRKLAATWPPSASTPERRRFSKRATTMAWAASLCAGVAIAVFSATTAFVEHRSEIRRIESETVNDHLRILGGAPLAQVTGGI